MQTKNRNKMMTSENAGVKGEVQAADQEFFFPGGLEYLPVTIIAKTQEEANEKWLRERQKVEK